MRQAFVQIDLRGAKARGYLFGESLDPRYTISVTTWDPSHKRRSHKAQLTDPIENRRDRELLGYLNRLWEKRVDARLASRRRDTS
jgi:hypothetical protein